MTTQTALPQAVYDAAQVAAFDARLINDFGVPGLTLMQRAAAAAYAELRRRWPRGQRLSVVCGAGNNGGDGYLLAEMALAAGWRVQLISLVTASRLQGDAAQARAAFVAAGGRVEAYADIDTDTALTADVIVDAVFGTGLRRTVKGDFAAAIAAMNAAHAAGAGVLAVDMASGVDASTGRLWGTAVRADVTVTFIALKCGLLTGAGPGYCGDIVFADLQAPAALYAQVEPVVRCIDDGLRRRLLPPRQRHVHKGDNGRVLCLGGNRGYGGAIRMSAEAALRTGAGLVSVACHGDHVGAMSQARPELMCRGVHDGTDSLALVDWASVIAVGPGLGTDDWARALLRQALDSPLPLIVDADALNLLAAAPLARGNWIITPHPGEAARLLGVRSSDISHDRPAHALALARHYEAIVVLKGAGSLVATPTGLWLCTAGNPGMATAGMGDLLTGIIAGLVAQGLTLADAAVLGVWMHARAADQVAAEQGQRGLLAMDVLPALRQQVNPCCI